MKYLLILFLCGCTSSDVSKLRSENEMLRSINSRFLESQKRSVFYSEKPLPILPPFPSDPPKVVYIFTNANSRMQADPEWLKTVNGVDYWTDRDSVRRMNNRMEAIELILRGAHIIEENR